jgi:hypothetical protein
MTPAENMSNRAGTYYSFAWASGGIYGGVPTYSLVVGFPPIIFLLILYPKSPILS